MAKHPKAIFISHADRDHDIRIFHADFVTLAELKWSPQDHLNEHVVWEQSNLEQIRKVLENAFAKQPAQGKHLPECVVAVVSALFDPPTREDLELILADFARERQRMQETGIQAWRIEIAILREVARTLLGRAEGKGGAGATVLALKAFMRERQRSNTKCRYFFSTR